MRSILLSLTTVMTLALSATVSAQSLAELAQKEKERRDKVKASSQVITNKDTAKYSGGAVTTQSPPPVSQKAEDVGEPRTESQAGSKPAKAEKAASDEPADLFGRPESFWRQTFVDARKQVKDLEEQQRALQLKLAELQNRFYSEADGFRQQGLQKEINKTFYEQDLNSQNLAKAKAALQQLEVEARKSGALPGWIEGRP